MYTAVRPDKGTVFERGILDLRSLEGKLVWAKGVEYVHVLPQDTDVFNP